MFKIIQELPPDVLGVAASGKITDTDYTTVLIPRAKKMLTECPSIKLLYVAGKDFKGYDHEAVWDDTVFGVKHWRDFSHIAVVTDVPWLRTATSLVSPFFPGVVKVFGLADLAAAKAWIAKAKKAPGKKQSDMLKDDIIVPLLSNISDDVKKEEKRNERR